MQATKLKMGFCAQENNLPSSLTVSELINLFSSLLHSGQDDKNEKEKYREDLLERLSLTGHLGSQYGSLSIGVKRKVGLLLALVNKPELILLDEPVAGLDDASQKEFWGILGQLRGVHTMVVITHNITPAQDTADYCAILHRG